MVTEDIYISVSQLVPCTFFGGGHYDRRTSINKVVPGWPGVACKHCKGTKDEAGRWFPSGESAMYTATFMKGVTKHLKECAHCPSEVSFVLAHFHGHVDEDDSNKQLIHSLVR